MSQPTKDIFIQLPRQQKRSNMQDTTAATRLGKWVPVLELNLPCPYCGGTVREATELELDAMSDPRAWVAEYATICNNCQAYHDQGYD